MLVSFFLGIFCFFLVIIKVVRIGIIVLFMVMEIDIFFKGILLKRILVFFIVLIVILVILILLRIRGLFEL